MQVRTHCRWRARHDGVAMDRYGAGITEIQAADSPVIGQTIVQIAEEAERNPELVRSAPHKTKVSRLDEVKAARQPNLRWNGKTSGEESGG